MSAVFDKVCPFCGRPQLLWGGETCDVCDRDNNGINDRDEPIAIPTTVDEHLLFRPEEKGWQMLTNNPSVCQNRLSDMTPRGLFYEISETPRTSPIEKGWEAIGSRTCQKPLPCHPSLVDDITKRELVARTLIALHRHFKLEGYGNCETGYIVTTKTLLMRGSMSVVKL